MRRGIFAHAAAPLAVAFVVLAASALFLVPLGQGRLGSVAWVPHVATATPGTTLTPGASPSELPASVSVASSPAGDSASIAIGPAALSIGVGWDGIDYRATGSCSSCLVPDVSVASGNGYVVEVTSSLIREWTTAGVQVFNESLDTFADTGATDHLIEPEVVYDTLSQRWFISIMDASSGAIYYGGSLTSDPSHAGSDYWNFQHFPAPKGGMTFDQPRLAVDGDEVVIVANLWSGPTTPVGFEVMAANESQLVTGAAPQTCTTPTEGSRTDASYVPASVMSLSNTTYLVSDNAGNTTGLNLRTLSGTPATCTLSAAIPLLGTSTPTPPNATQPGTSDLIRTLGNISSATWRNGTLWVAAANGCVPTGDSAPRSCLHLWEIDTTDDSFTQDFNWSRGSGYYDFDPAVTTDPAGDLIVVFAESSAAHAEYPSLYVATQAVTDPTDTLEAPILLRAGTGPDSPTSSLCTAAPAVCPFSLWFGAAADPLTPSGVWVAGEYMASDSTTDFWNTWINKVASAVGSTWIAGSVSPPTAQVVIDGSSTALVAGLFNVTVLAGTHTVQASLAGYLTYSTTLTVGAGQGVQLAISLVPGPTAPTTGRGLFAPVPLWELLAMAAAFVAVIGAVVVLLRRRKAPPRSWRDESVSAGTAGLASAIASALDKRAAEHRDPSRDERREERERWRERGGVP